MARGADIPYGQRLIPNILDDLAIASPNRTVYTIAALPDGPGPFQHISASAFLNAVDKTSWWLREQLGTPTSIEPLGYIGPHDLRYILLTYGAAKAGYTTDTLSHALFLSPKNNTEGALAVLRAANCTVWVHPAGQQRAPLVTHFLEERPMRVLELPEVAELLNAEGTKPFPYTKTFENAATEPFCMLHTSGTTGTPKPISWTHALIGTMDAVRLLPPTPGDNGLEPWTANWKEGDTLYSSFPMSHGAGIIMDILMPSLFGLRCVLGPAGTLPNMNLIGMLADHAGIDIWSMVPSLVDELGETPDVLDKMRSSKFICASGGPVSPEIASKVNDAVRILNLTGTTEGLFIGNLVVDREDWHWFAFHPYSGFEFKEVEEGVYEHWVHRNEHWPLFQGIFHTFPDKDSINLKDLYIRHPTKAGLWAFRGRSDDVVVLSNGYKISPLSTEAYIATHPAIHGCLVIGTGKSQAGLLIELNDGVTKNNDLFDSIWETVERSNDLSSSKNRLLRNYVAFAEPDKPFVRTDKGTIKRHATLVLYADFIDRFYESRDDEANAVEIDTSSEAAIVASLRHILAEALPNIHDASVDEDLFELGLDSLFVFRTVSALRVAMNLKDKLGPRHLYANPTLAKFSALLARLALENGSKAAVTNGDPAGDDAAQIQRLIAQHHARLSFKMNALDYVNANHYMGLTLYFSLREDVSFQEAFAKLQRGLHRALQLIPGLDGQMMSCSEQEIGYKRGDLRLVIPPLLSEQSPLADPAPRQLIFRDLSEVLPSFEDLRAQGFPPSAVADDLVLPCDPFPAYPADVLVARANFVKGGCILAANFHHGCLDAVGVMVALKTWGESCRFIEGDSSATCEWLDPESFNHSLPEILHDLDTHRPRAQDVDPGVWGFLPFVCPDSLKNRQNDTIEEAMDNFEQTNGHAENQNGHITTRQTSTRTSRTPTKPLPPPPVWPYQLGWPPAPDAAGRELRNAMFLIPAESVEKLKQVVMADPEADGAIKSISDIVQAFFWRVAIRARYRVATELRGNSINADEPAILELPIDGRPYFSPLLPSSYMGSMLILNRPTMPIRELCSPSTSIAHVAQVLRQAAARITPALFTDAFTLLRSLPHYDPTGQFSLADMGLDGMHSMISNMILFQPSETSFGEGFFANAGSPESLRPQLERGRSRFRFLVIHPMRKDGGVELVLGTLPEELEMLKQDGELLEFARLVDY